MGRFRQPPGIKGSLRWTQHFVEDHPVVLDGAIGLGPIDWRSPRRHDDWAEYRDAAALALFDVTPRHRALADFWPTGGPQWDALGRAANGDVVLVEAKAHVKELLSSPAQAGPESLTLIRRSLEETAAALGANPGTDWTRRFYQYANRLAHAHFLRTINGVPTCLVFLYFIGVSDPGVEGLTSRAEWDAALTVLHEAMGLRGRLPPYVKSIFIDVRSPILMEKESHARSDSWGSN